MRWTPENDQLLLVMLLETHNINVKGEKISAAWPQDGREAPSARAITERIVKIRALAKPALAASPLANSPSSSASSATTAAAGKSPEKKKRGAGASGGSTTKNAKKKAKNNFEDHEKPEEGSREGAKKRKVKKEVGGGAVGNVNGGYDAEEESLMSARNKMIGFDGFKPAV